MIQSVLILATFQIPVTYLLYLPLIFFIKAKICGGKNKVQLIEKNFQKNKKYQV